MSRKILAPLVPMLGPFAGSDVVASPPAANDVYVVEYPKSGITWLTTIMANLALLSSGREDIEVTFANLRLIVPDVHLGREIGQPVYSSPPFRFIKSHSPFEPRYTFVIYLVRNPFSVATSYYRYIIGRGQREMSFGSYLRNPKLGIQNWQTHVLSWLDRPGGGGIMHLLRYEDLVQDTKGEILALCANLGWCATETQLETAIERSAADRMKASEARFVSRDPRYKAGFVKGPTFEIRAEDRDYIARVCAEGMERLGYARP